MSEKTKTIVGVGLITAIVVVLQSLAVIIPVGIFNLNLVLVPIVVGAALYGPKIDFMFKDALGREIQIPTIQYKTRHHSPYFQHHICYHNYYLFGLTNADLMNSKYAESTTWASNVNRYITEIKNS